MERTRLWCALGAALLLVVFCETGYGQEQRRVGAYVLGQVGWTAFGQANGAIGEGAAGVRIGRWGLGLASGVDNVGPTSIPLLMDARWTLWRAAEGKNALCLFSQQGGNFVTQKAPGPIWWANDGTDRKYGAGLYWMGGVAWKISMGKAGAFLVSAGCTYKQFVNRSNIEHYVEPEGFPVMVDSGPSFYKTTDKIWSGVVMVGWEW